MNIIKGAIYHLANISTAIRDGYLKHLFQRTFRIARWKEFFWVVKHWRLYYNTISAMHNEWFDVGTESPAGYLGSPENWYCKHCGAKYVPPEPFVDHDRYSMLEWISNTVSEEDRQQHLPGCPHYDIVRLESCWR